MDAADETPPPLPTSSPPPPPVTASTYQPRSRAVPDVVSPNGEAESKLGRKRSMQAAAALLQRRMLADEEAPTGPRTPPPQRSGLWGDTEASVPAVPRQSASASVSPMKGASFVPPPDKARPSSASPSKWATSAAKVIKDTSHSSHDNHTMGNKFADVVGDAMLAWEREKKRLRDESKKREGEIYRKELAKWFADLFEILITDSDDGFFDAIGDGVLLCRLAAKANRAEVDWLDSTLASPPKEDQKDSEVKSVAKAKKRVEIRDPGFKETRGIQALARDNIDRFIQWSKEFGIHDSVLFESPAIKSHDRNVLMCLMEVARESHLELVPQIVETERIIDDYDGIGAALAEAEEARRMAEELARLQAEMEAAEAARIAKEQAEIEAAEAAERARLEAERIRLEEQKRLEEERMARDAEEARVQAELLAIQEAELHAKLAKEEAERRAAILAEELRRQQEAEAAEAAAAAERDRIQLLEVQRLREEEERRAAERRAAELRAAQEAEAERVRIEEERLAELERLRLAELDRLLQIAEEEEKKRLEELARRQAENTKAAQDALKKLQELAEAAERKREAEQERLRRLAEEQRLQAEAMAYRIELRRQQLEEQKAARAKIDALAAQLSEVRRCHSQQKGEMTVGLAALLAQQDEVRSAIEADESAMGQGKLDIIHLRIGQKEEMQAMLSQQRAKTDQIHLACQEKLAQYAVEMHQQSQAKVAREHELAVARAAFELARQTRVQAEATIRGESELDTEVQKMVRDAGAAVKLIRLKEGTYMVEGSTKKLFIRILHTNIMVRVGGGWETLRHWLKSHKSNVNPDLFDKRARKVRHFSPGLSESPRHCRCLLGVPGPRCAGCCPRTALTIIGSDTPRAAAAAAAAAAKNTFAVCSLRCAPCVEPLVAPTLIPTSSGVCPRVLSIVSRPPPRREITMMLRFWSGASRINPTVRGPSRWSPGSLGRSLQNPVPRRFHRAPRARRRLSSLGILPRRRQPQHICPSSRPLRRHTRHR